MPTQLSEFSVVEAVPSRLAASDSRRRITPQAGKALEILAHALEYLTDEYAACEATGSCLDPRLEAIELLMTLNRGIYMECPVAPPRRARRWSFLRRSFS